MPAGAKATIAPTRRQVRFEDIKVVKDDIHPLAVEAPRTCTDRDRPFVTAVQRRAVRGLIDQEVHASSRRR